MPSRNRKKRCKQRAEYLQKREDILSQENKAKARERYKADPEKKKASVRDTDPEKKKASVRDTYKADPEKKKASVRDTYNANAVSKRAAKRQRYQEGVEENRAAKRQRYQEGVEENRAANRRIYRGNSATIKAARRSQYWYWKGRRTTTTTQNYSLFEPNSRTLAEYGVRLEKAILRDSELLSEVNNAFCNSHPLLAQKVVTRSAHAAVSKISADALLAKALSVRRSQARSLLKAIRKVNAKKLQESDILVGHRFHTAGAEPYFFDNSYTHTKQHGAISVDLNGRCVVAEEIKDRDKMAEEVGKEFFDDSEGEEVEEAHTSSFITTSAPASASPTTSSSAAPASASPTTSSSAAPANASPTTSSSAAPASASPTTSSSAAPANASPTISSNAAPASASPTTMASSSAAPPPPPSPRASPTTTSSAPPTASTSSAPATAAPAFSSPATRMAIPKAGRGGGGEKRKRREKKLRRRQNN
ncbi:hypothetical protein EMCRGX_G020554 [Ephydatia muelleri]